MKNHLNPSIRQIKVYSIVTIFLIILGSGTSYWIAGRIEYYTNAVMHTSRVLQGTDELYSSILERETNVRGYVMSGNQQFLTSYNQSKVDVERLLNQLQVLTNDNMQQRNNIEELRGLINARLRTFEATIAYYKEHGDLIGFMGTMRVNNALSSYRLIKEAVMDINEVENKIFRQRNQGLINNINTLPLIVGLISVFSITIGLVTFFSIYQYNKSQLASNAEIALFQEKLRDQIKLLDSSNKELEQFAYVASHDLQEPLRKITAFSDLLNDQYADKLEGEGTLYLSRITAAAVRMRRLITDLLEYSRAGRIDTETLQTVKLSKVIAETLDDFELAIKDKSAKISLGKLPKVKGSNTEYRQVFQNLLSNSLKFSTPGIPPEISISCENANKELIQKYGNLDDATDYYLIKVADNGIGFDKEYADRIFAIFQRLHSKNEYEGTGIGLAITRKILEKNGGMIFADSIPGNGTTFSIILPHIDS